MDINAIGLFVIDSEVEVTASKGYRSRPRVISSAFGIVGELITDHTVLLDVEVLNVNFDNKSIPVGNTKLECGGTPVDLRDQDWLFDH